MEGREAETMKVSKVKDVKDGGYRQAKNRTKKQVCTHLNRCCCNSAAIVVSCSSVPTFPAMFCISKLEENDITVAGIELAFYPESRQTMVKTESAVTTRDRT